MFKLKNVFSMLFVFAMFLPTVTASANDFDWLRDLNIRAEASPYDYNAQLSARFKIGEAQVKIVLGNVDKPADAYMVFRLGELSSKPYDYVLKQYKAEKNRGWGVLAKNLGIKPGSREFHALKQGGDLEGSDHQGKSKGSPQKNKGKGKG